MASTSSKVWLTLAAAFGTLVITGVVLTAPSIQQCHGQSEGLWSCLRGELIEFGLLPDEPSPLDQPAVVADLPAGPPPSEPAPIEPEAPAPEPQPAASEPAEPASSAAPTTEPATGQTAEPPLVETPISAVSPADPSEPPAAALPAPASEPSPSSETEAKAEGEAEAPQRPVESADLAPPVQPSPGTPTAEPPIDAGSPLQSEPPQLQTRAVADSAAGIAAETATSSDLSPPPAPPLDAPLAEAPAADSDEVPAVVPPPEPADPSIAEAPSSEASAPDDAPALPAPPAEGSASDLPPTDALPEAPPPPPPGPILTATAVASASPGAGAAITPTIDAVEIDGSSGFIAGAGTDGSTVDLYVGQRYIGSADVEGGRWVFEASSAVDLNQLRVALAPQAQGRASLGSQTALSFNVAPTGVRLVGQQAAAELLPAQPDSQLEPTPANPALEAFVSVDPEILRFRSGKAIIRRGDTLWAIARRVYGRGALYPQIFQANRDQVRRPGRIYPGQVLVLPQAAP